MMVGGKFVVSGKQERVLESWVCASSSLIFVPASTSLPQAQAVLSESACRHRTRRLMLPSACIFTHSPDESNYQSHRLTCPKDQNILTPKGNGFLPFPVSGKNRTGAEPMLMIPTQHTREIIMGIYFWIAVGSGFGGVARFILSGFVAHHFGETFPWGTLLINVLGSFAIGFFATLTEPGGRIFISGSSRQFVMTGILGGFTTFSSFSLQTLALARDGEWFLSAGNAVGNMVLCLFAVWLGHLLAMLISQPH